MDIPTITRIENGKLIFVNRTTWEPEAWQETQNPVFVDFYLFDKTEFQRRLNYLSVGDVVFVGNRRFVVLRMNGHDFACRRVLAIEVGDVYQHVVLIARLWEIIELLAWASAWVGTWSLPSSFMAELGGFDGNSDTE